MILLEFSAESEEKEGIAEGECIGNDGADENTAGRVEDVDDGGIDENAG